MQLLQCRICGSNGIERFLDLGKQPWGNDFRREPYSCERFPLELYFCHKCSLVQLGYTVPKEKMFVEHSYMSGTTKTLRGHFGTVAEGIVAKYNIGGADLVVDIGGNDGTQLAAYQKFGARVLNVESGKAQAEAAIEAGINTINSFFDSDVAQDIRSECGYAKVINAAGVFFHLEELHSVADGIKLLLAPDGVFIVQFVYLGDIIASNSFDNVYHEHLLYYTLKTLTRLLVMHGLEPIYVERSPIHGGSIIAHVMHIGTTDTDRSVYSIAQNERELKYNNLGTYKAFAERAMHVRDRLQDIICGRADSGEIIYAYGAPVKGSTLINYCGFTSKQIQCAVEKNEHKCMRYYPGTDIPVIHEKFVNRPDLYLVLAWNFLKEIQEKEAVFLDNDGEFIVPIPNPTIIWRGLRNGI
ncbi:MAG: class I SAM-dependent methyltransferase [bacterium]